MNIKQFALLCLSLQSFSALVAMETRSKKSRSSASSQEVPPSVSSQETTQTKIYKLLPERYYSDPCHLVITDADLKVTPLNKVLVKKKRPTVFQASTLTKLVLHNNALTELPGLDACTNLEHLNLQNNNLRKLPGIGALTKLQVLIVTNNNLIELSGIGSLTHLLILNASSNNLTELPNLKALTNLVDLYLVHNQLTTLVGLDSLTKLDVLCLKDNQLKKLPGVENLKRLQYLLLAHNTLTQVPSLRSLTRLVVVDFSNNKLTEAPNFGELPHLRKLYLDNNPLTDLSGIRSLYSLEWLWINGCWLHSLPPELGNLKKLRVLNIMNNPFGMHQIPQSNGTVAGETASLSFILYRLTGRKIMDCVHALITQDDTAIPFACKAALALPTTAKSADFTRAMNIAYALITHKDTLTALDRAIAENPDQMLSVGYYQRQLKSYANLYLKLQSLLESQGLIVGNSLNSDLWQTTPAPIAQDVRRMAQRYIDRTISESSS